MTQTKYGSFAPKNTLSNISTVREKSNIGLKFPIGSSKVLLSKSTDNEVLVGQIKQLINTEPGERVMIPGFGLNISAYLFEQLTPELVDKIKKEIYIQFNRYIENCEILKCSVYSIDGEDPFSVASTPSVIIRLSVKNKLNNQILPLEFSK
jgi:phage baseplate assembly protein W